jgi:ATP-binding cassette subfamily F protein 3
MLKVQNLSKSYGGQLLFNDITFNINSRERIGLVGRNGHGKTTLLKLLLKQETPDSGSITMPRGYTIGYLKQLLDFSTETILDEAALGLPSGEKENRWKAEKVLAGLGFSQTDMSRPPSEFSGGFQVRLNLAKLLVSEPDLLLLDEPTNFLDILAIRWLERFLTSWRGELLVITHDRSFMDSVTSHTMGIHRTKLRKIKGDTGKYYSQISLEEEVHEKSRINIEKKRRDTEDFIRKFRAKARLVGLVQSRIRTLEKQEVPEALQEIQTLDFNFRSAPFASKVMMESDHISFSYSGEDPYLIEDLKLLVGKEDRIGVVGPNGRGKSTLLRILSEELAPLSGTVKKHPKLKIGYYGQTNVERLEPARTVVEEVLSSDPEGSLQRARNISGTMMFEGDAALKRISVLSGGERSRVLLGKLLLSPANLLLLDEPTNHLDMESCEALLEALEAFDGSVIIVTHNERILHSLVNRLIVFDQDKVSLFEGTYRNFLDEVGWKDEEEGTETAGRGDDDVRPNQSSRKEMKKARAQLVQERSRILRPLEEKVGELERRIGELESQLRTNEQALVEASTSGAVDEIKSLSRENHRLTTEIEDQYEQLYEVSEELEAAQEEWQEKT